MKKVKKRSSCPGKTCRPEREAERDRDMNLLEEYQETVETTSFNHVTERSPQVCDRQGKANSITLNRMYRRRNDGSPGSSTFC